MSTTSAGITTAVQHKIATTMTTYNPPQICVICGVTFMQQRRPATLYCSVFGNHIVGDEEGGYLSTQAMENNTPIHHLGQDTERIPCNGAVTMGVNHVITLEFKNGKVRLVDILTGGTSCSDPLLGMEVCGLLIC